MALSILTGVEPTTLQTWLAQAQTALATLRSGGQVREIRVGTGTGNREVQYVAPTVASLTEWILELQQALGIRRHRRRAIGVSF